MTFRAYNFTFGAYNPLMLYINNFCAYTTGGIIDPQTPLRCLEPAPAGAAAAREPDYKELIPPMQLRRMSKPIRMSIAAVKSILSHRNIPAIGAINVGTAYGLLADTEQFLSQLIQQEERMLTPTAFIQSTQNTIGGQIALLLGSHAHNMTFVQRGHSFEHALLDIELLEPEKDMEYIAGGVDELTPHAYTIINTLLRQHKGLTEDATLGEGTAFFRLSHAPQQESVAAIAGYHTFKSGSSPVITDSISDFLKTLSVSSESDWILGDINTAAFNKFYQPLLDKHDVKNIIHYKPYTSDYPTVAAAGLAFATRYLTETQQEQVVLVQNYYEYWSVFVLNHVVPEMRS